jgi:hypothetical protein
MERAKQLVCAFVKCIYTIFISSINWCTVTSVLPLSTGEIRFSRGKGKKGKLEPDTFDLALLEAIRDNRSQKSTDEKLDEEGLFGMLVAARLRKMSDHQRAIAQLRLQEVLLKVEFDYQYQSGSQAGSSQYMS